MGEEEEEEEKRAILHTPTWALATICLILIAVSILIEHSIHLLAKYLNKKRRRSLLKALGNIKSELMLMGFISLFLTVTEEHIPHICIEKSLAFHFLPCNNNDSHDEIHTEESSKCEEQDKMSLITRDGVQQIQLLIFSVAFFHIISSFLTFSLGMAKMKRWENWEAETRTFEYKFSNDPRRFQFTHQTSFGKRHLKFWSEYRFLRLPASFFRQFFQSVSKVDYFILRHGFIMAHFEEGSDFDFQKNLQRALDKDFGVVVGIRLWTWMFAVLFIFFNADEFYNDLWLPFVPLVMLLVVGTKLQGMITKMGLDTKDKSLVVRGTLLVRPSDHFFWFGKPKLLLHLMHFILFQNSFQVAFFAWSSYEFGLKSCFHPKRIDIAIRVVTGVVVHILCGYVTLPLYALVTQMGTSMRKSVFPEEVEDGLKKWRMKAKKNVARRSAINSALTSLNASPQTSLHPLPSFATTRGRSLSLKTDDPPIDDEGIVEVESATVRQEDRDHKRLGSFEFRKL
ncbi:MLO-like protein 12 isoform X1 [Apium graveolens]|uniref:MLO-like protein 12 isoform X1 n=2 Tax=Apium graveolens TaxID=4045 RepID=UPI003D7B9146